MKALTKNILQEVVDFCGVTGLMLKESKEPADYHRSIAAPVSLFPCCIPEPYFHHAIKVQPTMNTLVEKLARDASTIHKVLTPYTAADDFPKRLLAISDKYHATKHKQDVYLGIIRSDYMLDTVERKLLMVEYNTIASSFGVLSDKLNALQRHLYSRYPHLFPADFELSRLAPPNDFVEKATAAFAKCIELYRKARPSAKSVHIAVIVQEGERNVYDQKPLELAAFEKYGIPSMRLTFKESYENAKVDSETGVLTM